MHTLKHNLMHCYYGNVAYMFKSVYLTYILQFYSNKTPSSNFKAHKKVGYQRVFKIHRLINEKKHLRFEVGISKMSTSTLLLCYVALT